MKNFLGFAAQKSEQKKKQPIKSIHSNGKFFKDVFIFIVTNKSLASCNFSHEVTNQIILTGVFQASNHADLQQPPEVAGAAVAADLRHPVEGHPEVRRLGVRPPRETRQIRTVQDNTRSLPPGKKIDLV